MNEAVINNKEALLAGSNMSSYFVVMVSELVEMMSSLWNRKIKLKLSLSELSKLHQLQYLLE